MGHPYGDELPKRSARLGKLLRSAEGLGEAAACNVAAAHRARRLETGLAGPGDGRKRRAGVNLKLTNVRSKVNLQPPRSAQGVNLGITSLRGTVRGGKAVANCNPDDVRRNIYNPREVEARCITTETRRREHLKARARRGFGRRKIRM